MRLGVISDTHGLLRPEVFDVFQQVDHILHAGDIGGDHVISSLREIAQSLYVSQNTVKTHTRSIYRKLGASSREQAVARGRELGLLEQDPQR